MGQFKDRIIDNMNVHEMQEYLTSYRSQEDTGYIEFLEQQLEKAELLINKIKDITYEINENRIINTLIKSYYNDKK